MSSDGIPRFTLLNKATTYVSTGLMVLFCGGMFWIGDTTATISAKMEAIPTMQQDIRAMKDILGRSNGTLLQHHSEIELLKERVKILETKPIPPKWFRDEVADLKRRIERLEKE